MRRIFLFLLLSACVFLPGGTVWGASSSGSEPVKITLSAAGDCTLGVDSRYSNSFNRYYSAHDASYFLSGVKSIFGKDDLTIVNLEGTLTTSSDRANKKFTFKGPTKYAKILTKGSVEVVNISNNHTRDFGQKGYDQTLSTLKKNGIAYCGEGTISYQTVKGVKIAFLGFNALDGVSTSSVKSAVKKAKDQGAVIIVTSFHWGVERSYTPNSTQKKLAHAAIDAGATLVLGHHPHVLQGVEQYKGRYIVYSLGNFCFGGNSNPSDKDTMIFQQTFTVTDGKAEKNNQIRVIPCSVSSRSSTNDFHPTVLSGSSQKRVLGKINKMSKKLGVTFRSDGTASTAGCKHDTYRTVTTPATETKNGSIVRECTFCGKVISKKSIARIRSVGFSKDSYIYTGKTRKPSVKVTDTKGKKISSDSYTVKYKNNKKVGTASVTVRFRGNYSGTKKLTFTIRPKTTKITELTPVSEGFRVTWKAQKAQTDGYQIQIAEDAAFTENVVKKTIRDTKTVSKTFRGLSEGTKYYVRMRTYRIVDEKKIVSSWSETGKVTAGSGIDPTKGGVGPSSAAAVSVGSAKKGAAKNGFVKNAAGETCYYVNGKKVTGWRKISGAKYYFSPNGRMATGWKKISGAKYYFGTSGKMRTGWHRIDGAKYYFGTNGKMRTGWHKIDEKKYYFGTNGKMARNQIVGSEKNGYYYVDQTGVRVTDPQIKEAVTFVMKHSDPSQSRRERLRSCYQALCKYHHFPINGDQPSAARIPLYADYMFTNHRGNCYRYASAMSYIAKVLGYESRVAVGGGTHYRNHRLSPHGWCEVKIGNTWKMIDCSMQRFTTKYTLFLMTRKEFPYWIRCDTIFRMNVKEGEVTWK